MKRYTAFLLCALIILCCAPFAGATANLPLVVDHADLLTPSEESILENAAVQLQEKYGFDVVILTLDSLSGNSIEYIADSFYDNSGYCDNGVVFAIAIDEREWYISTCGDVISALTDYGISRLQDDFLPGLSSGQYYNAFSAYMDALPQYFDAYHNGSPIDGLADYSGDYYHGTQEEVIFYTDHSAPNLLISCGIGLIAAIIAILIMRSAMNTKRPQASAVSYMIGGSYHLRTRQDLYLYSNVSKIRRQENNTSGGGGSSVHRSSSGRSHGGGGGKF